MDALNDIATAVMHLKAVLRRHGLEPPTIIELASREQLRRLEVLSQNLVATPVFDHNKAEMTAELCGVQFRAPAQFSPLPRGGFDVV